MNANNGTASVNALGKVWAWIMTVTVALGKAQRRRYYDAKKQCQRSNRIARALRPAAVNAYHDWAAGKLTLRDAKAIQRRYKRANLKCKEDLALAAYWLNRYNDTIAQLKRAKLAYASGRDCACVMDLPIFNDAGKIDVANGTTSVRAREYRATHTGHDVAAAYVRGLAVTTTSLTHIRFSSIRTVMKTAGQYANKMALIGRQLRPITSAGLSSESPLLFWQIGECQRRILADKKGGRFPRAAYAEQYGYPVKRSKALAVLAEIKPFISEYYWAQIDTIAAEISNGRIPKQLRPSDIYQFDILADITGRAVGSIGEAQTVMRQYRAVARALNGEPAAEIKGREPAPKWVMGRLPWGDGSMMANLPGLAQLYDGPSFEPLNGPIAAHATAPKLTPEAWMPDRAWMAQRANDLERAIAHDRAHTGKWNMVDEYLLKDIQARLMA